MQVTDVVVREVLAVVFGNLSSSTAVTVVASRTNGIKELLLPFPAHVKELIFLKNETTSLHLYFQKI